MVKRKSQGCLVVFVVLGVFACFLSAAIYLKYEGDVTVKDMNNSPRTHEDFEDNIGIGKTFEKSDIKFSVGEASFGSTAITDVKEFTTSEEASKFLRKMANSDIIRTVDLPNGNIRIWYVRYGREPLSISKQKELK